MNRGNRGWLAVVFTAAVVLVAARAIQVADVSGPLQWGAGWLRAGVEKSCQFLVAARTPWAMDSRWAAAIAGVLGREPGTKTQKEEQTTMRYAVGDDPDPSYRMYQRYRYAYEKYGYLFSFAGEQEESGVLGSVTEVAGSVVNGETAGGAGDQAPEAFGAEAGSAGQPGTGAEGAAKATIPTLAQLQDYDFLMKHYYSVHPSTTAPRELMQADTLLGTDLSLPKQAQEPQILIYHTHSQETYQDYGPGNLEANVVSAGNYLTELLTEKGWNVIHDTSAYDMQGGKLDRNLAYTYALEGITQILQQNPSIQVVVDLHRDGVGENTRLVAEANGKTVAKMMFFDGMSRTPDGVIDYLPNPYLQENLAFAFQMQLAAESEFPGVMRKIYLKGLRYNLHMRPRSVLVEVGAQTNTGAEAMGSMEVLAKVLDRVLQGE